MKQEPLGEIVDVQDDGDDVFVVAKWTSPCGETLSGTFKLQVWCQPTRETTSEYDAIIPLRNLRRTELNSESTEYIHSTEGKVLFYRTPPHRTVD